MLLSVTSIKYAVAAEATSEIAQRYHKILNDRRQFQNHSINTALSIAQSLKSEKNVGEFGLKNVNWKLDKLGFLAEYLNVVRSVFVSKKMTKK